MKDIKKLIELARYKHKIDIKRGDERFMDFDRILQNIISEIDEVKEEIKPNNTPHLEDELSDILWGWMILVEKLKDSGYVDSFESIFKRALKKYEERILPLKGEKEDFDIWRDIKIKQKNILKKEKKMRLFRDEVREYYKSYYENSDEAHLIDHPDSVCDLALKINKEFDETLVILSAYIHDIFNKKDRKNHHKLAYEYVINSDDKYLKELSDQERKLIAHAVLEHRASFKGIYYSKLSEIISSADRGLPDFKHVIKRSIKFNNNNIDDVYKHIKEKYTTDGYAVFPDAYREIFSDELQRFQKLADELTKEQIIQISKEENSSV